MTTSNQTTPIRGTTPRLTSAASLCLLLALASGARAHAQAADLSGAPRSTLHLDGDAAPTAAPAAGLSTAHLLETPFTEARANAHTLMLGAGLVTGIGLAPVGLMTAASLVIAVATLPFMLPGMVAAGPLGLVYWLAFAALPFQVLANPVVAAIVVGGLVVSGVAGVFTVLAMLSEQSAADQERHFRAAHAPPAFATLEVPAAEPGNRSLVTLARF